MKIEQITTSGTRYFLEIPDENPKTEDTNKVLTELVSLLWEQKRG